MKKLVTVLIMLCLWGFTSLAQSTCTQSNSGSGNDDTNFDVTISAFPCVGAGTITAMTLTTTIGSYCGSWYSYDLIVNGTPIATNQCNLTDYDLTPYLPITSITMNSNDLDVWPDNMTMSMTCNITYTPAPVPPLCALISSPSDLATNVLNTATLNWLTGDASTTGYKLFFGTDYPPTNILNNSDLLNVTSYDPIPDLAFSTTYYWRLAPYNIYGDNTTCATWSFTTGPNPALTTFPSCEGFEGSTFAPYGWTNVKTAGTTNPGIWDRQTSGTYPTCVPHSGTYMTRFNCYSIQPGGMANLVSPPIDFPTDLYRVKFWMFRDDGYTGTPDLVNVYYNTTPGLTGATLLGTINRHFGSSPVESVANQWYEYSFNMPAGSAGTGRYVIFEGVSAYGNNIFMDDICVEEQPACPNPIALTATNFTTTSADLGWTENGTATTWNVEWGVSGFTQGLGTTVIVNTLPTTPLSGLIANTDYEFYVQADCGGSLSTWSGPYLFTTLCNAITTLPYTEGFEGASFPPACWSNAGWELSSYGDPNTGVGWAYSNLSGSILTSPSFTLSSNSRLRYWYRVESATYPQDMNVLLSTDGINFTTTLANYVGIVNNTYAEAVIDLSAYTGQTVTIRFNGLTGVGGFDWGVLVDDFTMEVIPLCNVPTALTATNIATNSADLGWTSGGASLWNIEYGPQGFTQGTGTIIHNASNTYTVNGLTPFTAYDFYVQDSCGASNSSLWAGPFTFTTLCGSVATFPFTEDFTAGLVPPDCWSEIITNTTQNWVYNAGGYANVLFDYSQNEWLITPVLDFSTLTNPYVSFDWMMSYAWSVDPDNNYDLICKVSTNGGVTWDSLWTEAAEGIFTSWNWYTKTINLQAYAGQSNVKIAWQYLGNDGAQGAIDNILVDEALVPSITSLGSTSGCVGSDLIINGINMDNAISVTIGGTAAVITVNSGTAITVNVGTGTTGTVAVTTIGGTATSTETFTVNQLPSLFTVSGGGIYCSGGSGVTIALDGSENGMNYDLSTSPVTTLPGTGSALTFGPTAFATGTYTITATNGTTGCSLPMTGSVVVTVNPSPYSVTATASNNTICEGTSIDLFSTANSADTAIVNVLTEDFETSPYVPPTGWANLNGGLGNVWTTSSYGTAHGGTYAAEYKYNSANPADAWLISPGLNFTAGSVYTIKYWERTSSSYVENLKVTIGTDQTIASQTVLEDLLGLQHADYVEHTITYTCTTSGTYYIGWNCYSLADKYFLDIDDISVTTTAVNPPSYSWTSLPAGYVSASQNPTAVAPTVTTEYIVAAQNSYGCITTASTTVNVNPLPVVTLGSDITICGDQSTILDAGNPGASYLWTPGGQITQTITADSLGLGIGPHTFSVLVTDPYTCSATGSIVVTFDPCTGVNENNDGITVSVIPNPSNGMFYLNVEGINEAVTLNIYAINGKVIYSEQVDNTGLINKPIDLKSYPKGMYFLRLINNNMTHTEKIIIE